MTITDYTPITTGPLTKVTVTDPKGQKSYTYLDYARGTTVKSYDVNTKLTESTYDALGRAMAVWLPNRSRSGGYGANYTYAYSVSNKNPSWSSTSTIRGEGVYNTTYTIYDSLLRPLQTQSPTGNGGRLLTDTRYDSRGLAYETYADVFDSTATPTGIYARAEYGGAPKQTDTVFDGAGRPTTSTLYIYGVKKWSTTTGYTGDSTATTAPTGGSAVRTLTDVFGRTTERREYSGTDPADTAYGAGVGAAYTSTKYSYTRDSKPDTITGTGGAQWSYTYDLFARQTTATDPDEGKTTTSYTDLDQVAATTDFRNTTLLYGYDVLGRTTDEWQTSKTDANKLAHWAYDTLVKGQLDSGTSYVGGMAGTAYTRKVTAYDSLYRPTTTQLVLPSTDALVTSGAVAATLTSSTYYNLDGTQQYVSEPEAGGLAAETVNTGHDTVGLPTTVSGASDYLLRSRLLRRRPDRTVHPRHLLGRRHQEGLHHQHVGGRHRSAQAVGRHGPDPQLRNARAELQLRRRGQRHLHHRPSHPRRHRQGRLPVLHLRRPPTSDRGLDPVHHRLLGIGPYHREPRWRRPYWTSYSYTDSGLRTTDTTHTSAGDTARTYCYSATRPHALTATTAASSCTGVTAAYSYDPTGNTTGRPNGTDKQTLTWTPEGQLDTLTEKTGSGTTKSTTSHIYDADGNLLIRRNTSGETVLYLDGGTEVHLDTSTSTAKHWAQRYYSAGGSVIALRTNKSGTSTLTWLAADQHGTSSLALDATTQAVTKRYTNTFGVPRTGSTGTWPDDKAFLGASADPGTGLTHLGAREYDPSIGRFISVDPVLNLAEQQSLNGYTYGNNNPATLADPAGTDPCGGLKCGHEGDKCSDPAIYCYAEKADGTADTTGAVPSGGGTASTSSTGKTTSGKKSGSHGGWLSNTVNTVVDYGSAIFSQPDVWWGAAETGGSMFLMGLGGDAIVGGGALCLTGVGCIAGAPIAAGGAGLIGAGAVGAADGIGRINDGLGKAFTEASSESSGSASSANGGMGDLVKVNKPDGSADALAERLGGESRVRFSNDPEGREFDAVSDTYVAQAKPENFILGKKFRKQAAATFQMAKTTGRVPYFQFDGPPGPGVVDAIRRYTQRYQMPAVIDTEPVIVP